jgi:hypothetical protein
LATLRPNTTDLVGAWKDHSGGTDLAGSLDEVSQNDTDYIVVTNPVDDICRVNLGGDIVLDGDEPITIGYTLGATEDGVIDMTVRLKQGAALIATWTHTGIPAAITLHEQELTDPERESIDWGNQDNLKLEFVASGGTLTIGGVSVGDEGEVGTIYEGYTLSWGHDFSILDIVTPNNPAGKWFTNRTYLPGARTSDSLLNTMYDTDPSHTGHADVNRGEAVGFDNMSIGANGILLQARAATSPEQDMMYAGRNEVSAMVSGVGAAHWYAGAAGTNDIIIEAREWRSTGSPDGWHPTFWITSGAPSISIDTDEYDYEGNSENTYFYRNIWTGGSSSGTNIAGPWAHDATYHTISFKVNTTNVTLYRDGVSAGVATGNGNSKGKFQNIILSSHILNGTFQGDTYSASAWDADVDGALLAVDWVRIWRRTGKTHYKPLVSVADANIDYGDNQIITLPSKTTLWGSTAPTEYLQVVYNDEAEPGVTHTTVFDQFPSGVSYDSGTREITINITSGNSGRMNFVLSAWETGGTGEPLRFAVNLSPRITLDDFNVATGSTSVDVYAQCDCGVLTPKTISVSNLGASGLSYNTSTGLLEGTAVEGTYADVAISCTNGAGQTTTATITITVAEESSDYTTWSGPGWFDASATATVTTSGTNVLAVANKRFGGGNLDYAGNTGDVDLIASAQNGLSALRLTRNITGGSTDSGSQVRPRLSAAVTDPLSTMFQGDDMPYTVIVAYKPTDSNTGFIWAASDTVDATDGQQIAFVRRSGSSCSIRRMLVTATPNDVNFGSGSGHASGSARIVAVKHTGTAVSVWDTSLTKSVNGTAQNVGSFNSELTFRLFASENPGTVDPAYQAVACACDLFEIIIEDDAKDDTFIEQAISDLADKWGITLT